MNRFLLYNLICFVFFCAACNSEKKPEPVVIVKTPEQVDTKAPTIIKSLLNEGKLYKGRIDDSLTLKQPVAVDSIYQGKDFNTFWSGKGQWHPSSDSLIDFITHAKLYGLFPEDYHLRYLNSIRSRMKSDTFITKDHLDAALWARADLLFTDALVQLTWDLKMGRLPADSITLRKDSVLTNEFYKLQFDKVLGSSSLRSILDSIEPKHNGYKQLKARIKNFLDSGDFKKYTFINFPTKDTAALKVNVQQRLFEGGYIPFNNRPVDSMQLSNGIRNYQIDKGLKADGKIGAETIRILNDFDNERFIRLAITLDRYKHLTPQLPVKYLWVNVPGFDLKLIENDSVKLYSKIVVGKPYTPTPVLTSALTDMITYPQWTVPQSIITKEILPATKKDPGYISKKGFSLVNDLGEEVDPYFVDWSLYKKIIPFKIVQGSGDDNALGIFKFNFNNKYAVYLHDTNQRHFFSKSERALSHGCVRVQEWQKLTYYILRNDSLNSRYSNYTSMDSIRRWLRDKEKHVIPVRNKIPIFIRYFTCESKNDKLVFYNDIYGEDKRLRDRYFRDK
jgi:L,D-transpeptidase YcbB